MGGRIGAVAGQVWLEYEEGNDIVEPRFGPQIAGVASYHRASFFSLQTELWVVQKGWTETRAGGTRRLCYAGIPLFLAATPNWRTAPQLLVGASVSRELACSVTGIPGVGSLGCNDTRVEWHRRKTQFGTWAGVGVRRWFGTSYRDIQLLGNVHLTNQSREPLVRG